MNDANWKTKTMLVGALAGALTGVGVAVLLIQRAEKTGEPIKIGASEGLKLGMGVLGLMRQLGPPAGGEGGSKHKA